MISGPFASDLEACEAFAALKNREEPPAKFVATLHPLVSLITKRVCAEGKAQVAFQLAEWGHWYEPSPPPVAHVTVIARHETDGGLLVPVCCTLYIHKPTHLQTETYITLEDGWVRKIFTYSVWLDPKFPFPERVLAAVARLQSKGVPLAPPTK